MLLRDYQNDAIDKLRASLRSGKRRPVIQAPTGAGKTVIAAAIIEMARAKGKRVLFCVPALELINQTVDRFARNGILDVGVIQAQHELTDGRQPIQICSVQTLARRQIPDADLVIIDEAHVMFKLYDTWTTDPKWANVPFVGLSATPWQKGMGRIWDDLIVSVTTQELIDQGHLSDFRVFAPSHPDLTGVKTVMGDYEAKGLGHAMDKPELIADIVTTWQERAAGLPTLCFAVNRVHAKHLQSQFDAAGIKTGYVDAYSTREERNEVARDFENGDITVVCNVGVLTTGVDWDVRCVILARPTRSEILYVQIIGRGLRTAPGKSDCIILDHSDTTLRLGLVTDIKHDSLDDGRIKAANEARKERLPKECPKCAFVKPVKVHVCPSCGFKPEAFNKIETANGELMEILRGGKKQKPTMLDKLGFYSQLLRYSRDKGYSDGWAYHSYRDRYGVGPSVKPMAALYVEPATEAWIKHRIIRRARALQKAGQ